MKGFYIEDPPDFETKSKEKFFNMIFQIGFLKVYNKVIVIFQWVSLPICLMWMTQFKLIYVDDIFYRKLKEKTRIFYPIKLFMIQNFKILWLKKGLK